MRYCITGSVVLCLEDMNTNDLTYHMATLTDTTSFYNYISRLGKCVND